MMTPYQNLVRLIGEAHEAIEKADAFDLVPSNTTEFEDLNNKADHACLALVAYITTHTKEIIEELCEE
jgi:hypothetical protein